MEEIEVGEYVRTKRGEIHKIVDVKQDEDNPELWNYYNYENGMGDFRGQITKHSKNIIDLIEVGDFVNGELVREPIDKENGYNSDYTGFQQFLNVYGEIKSILTHEQYENNCYRLEE